MQATSLDDTVLMQRDEMLSEKPPSRHQQLQDATFKLLDGTSLEKYLSTHASRLPNGEKRKVVILDEKATVASTLKELAERNILSAPLIDSTNFDYLGFVSAVDVVNLIIRRIDPDVFRTYTHAALYTKRQIVRSLVDGVLKENLIRMRREGGGDGQLLFRGYGSASLYSVIIKGFLEPAKQPWTVLGVCHRIAVFDYDDAAAAMKITDIVSQSDLIRFLLENIDKLGPVVHMTVRELGLAPKEVLCVSESLSALEGFAALMRQRVSALAVVSEGQDGSRSLVSALSASHLRYVATADDLQALALPVPEFVARSRSSGVNGSGGSAAERPQQLRKPEEGSSISGDSAMEDAPPTAPAGAAAPPTPAAPRDALRTGAASAGGASAAAGGVVTCTLDTTLGELLRLLSMRSTHHVFVVASAGGTGGDGSGGGGVSPASLGARIAATDRREWDRRQAQRAQQQELPEREEPAEEGGPPSTTMGEAPASEEVGPLSPPPSPEQQPQEGGGEGAAAAAGAAGGRPLGAPLGVITATDVLRLLHGDPDAEGGLSAAAQLAASKSAGLVRMASTVSAAAGGGGGAADDPDTDLGAAQG